jgi:hypothetical protein
MNTLSILLCFASGMTRPLVQRAGNLEMGGGLLSGCLAESAGSVKTREAERRPRLAANRNSLLAMIRWSDLYTLDRRANETPDHAGARTKSIPARSLRKGRKRIFAGQK